MRDEREVVGFLDGACGEHRPARGPRVHDVAVVAVDRERVRGQRPGRDMDDRRRQLARDLEHVRDHQEQALGRREGGGQRALLQRPVEGTGRAALGLHLDHVGDLAPQVRLPGSGPVVGVLRHGRRGCDREDRDHLAQGVGDAGRGLVAVHAHEDLAAAPSVRCGGGGARCGNVPLQGRLQGHAGPPIARRRLARLPPSTCFRIVAPMPAARASRASSAPRYAARTTM